MTNQELAEKYGGKAVSSPTTSNALLAEQFGGKAVSKPTSNRYTTREEAEKLLEEGEKSKEFLDKGFFGQLFSKEGGGQGLQDILTSVKNIPSSASTNISRTASGLFDVLKSPIQAAKGIGKTALGGLQKLVPGEQEEEALFDQAFKAIVTDRYGSPEKWANTVKTDPVGYAMDLADVIMLVGGGTKSIAKFSDNAKLLGIGEDIIEAGKRIDPITIASRGATKIGGKIADKFEFTPIGEGKFPEADKDITGKYGIETLPSQTIASDTLKEVEKIGFGKEQQNVLDTMRTKISGIEDTTRKAFDYDANLKKISTTIQKELGDIDANFKDTKDALYATARESIAATKKVDVSDYVEYLKEQVKFMQKGKGVQSPALTPFLKELEQFVIRDEAGKITGYNTTMKFDALVSGVENLEAAMVKDPTRLTSNLVGKAKDTLKEVMEGTNFERNMTLAEEAFKKVKDVTESDAFKKLLKNPGDPEYIYKVFPKQSPSMATSIMEIMPKSIIDDVRNVFQRELITEMFKADGVTFKANGVNSVIKKWGASTIEAVIGKDGLKSLQNMQEVESDIIKLKDILKVGEDLGKTPKNVKFVTDLVNKAPGGIFVNVLYNYLDNKLTKKFINTPWVQEILRGGSFKLPDVPSIPFEIDNMSSKTRTLSEILRRKGELEE